MNQICKSFSSNLSAFFIACFAFTVNAQTDFWQQTNGPFGGNIGALAIDSTGQVFAGTASGIFRSSNGGDTWSTTGLNGYVVAMAMNREQHIFAGTNGGGVYRSTDNGDTWSQVNTGLLYTQVKALAINHNGHIFAGTLIGGVYRSTNNGVSWRQVNTGLTNSDVHALAINSTGHIFAGTFGGGVFLSIDNGETWSQINTGLTEAYVDALAINSDDHIFAGTEGGVFRSTDNGQTWSASLIPAMVTYGQVRVQALSINGAGDIFAGTEYSGGIYRSENNGNTWSQISTGLTNEEVQALAVNRNGHIFAGTLGGGVFRSTDNGDNWDQTNSGMIDTAVRTLAIAPGSDGQIFAGTFGSGVFRSTDNGDTWIKTGLMESRDAYIQALATNRGGHIFAGTWAGVPLFRSTDNGNTWSRIGSGLNTQAVEALAINKEGHIFAGTRDGVFRSTNNGNTWNNTGLTNTGAQSLAIDSAGTVFAGTYGDGVFRSTDNGENWRPINNGLTSTDVKTLAINDAEHIFAGTTARGVFRSTDQGDSWQAINFGLTHLSVPALVINSESHILAATGLGVFRSTNNGENWSPLNSGLTNLSVISLAIDSAGTVFAGTWWGGVFRLTPANLPPAAPTGLIAESDFSKIVLRWNRNLESDLLRYRLYRGTSSPANALIDSVQAGTETYSDNNVVSGTTYYYRITAVDKTRIESNFSNQAQVAFVANQPPSVANAIPNQTLIAGGAVFVRDLNAAPAVFSDPDGDVLSYAASSSATHIATADVAASILTIAPVAEGTATITITVDDGKRGLQATVFDVTVKANQPPLIVHSPFSARQRGEEIVVQADITDDLGIASAMLYYRRGGDPVFNALAMSNNANSYQATIPANAVTSRGVEYFILAADVKNVISRLPASGIFSNQVRVANETKPSPQPGGSSQTAYRLVSVPLDLDDKNAKTVLEDDLGKYDDTKWRFFEFLANQTNAEISAATMITPGKAFWLLVKDAGKVIDTGAGKSNLTSRPYAIPMHPAWNFVANPFNFAIPVENISLQSGKPFELRSYSGNWNDLNAAPVDTVKPFEGYAVVNELSIFDTLLVNPDLSSSPNSLRKNITATDLWSIRILAQCQQARDVDNLASIVAGAEIGFDAWDRPEPPPVGEYVSVSFPHRDWAPPVPTYCIDARPEPLQGEIWEFEVTTNIRDKVTLTFEGATQAPPEFAVWLVDEALNISQNLRENNQYAVAVPRAGKPKRLKLVVGHQNFVAEKLGESEVVPTRYELSQNFPNPFWSEATSRLAGNPMTTIRYGLPKGERVTLKIYNLLGEEVVTLVRDEQREAGYHAAIWDGRNAQGQAVASGIYLYQLRTAGFVLTRRMALVW